MTRDKLFSATLLIPMIAAIGSEVKAEAKQPNIICIVTEDIGPYLRCYGDPVAKTPHLDCFAQDAIRYNMYTSIGISSPSRYSLITGRYPSSDGANYMRSGEKDRPDGGKPYEVIAPDGVRCMSEYLREAGYFCTNNGKTDYQFRSPLTAWDESSQTASWNMTESWNIRRPNQPFFAVFNCLETHESRIWMNNDLPLAVNPDDVIVPPYYPDTPTVRHDMAVMYTNIARMDRIFGRFVEELEEAGEMDNTIVIFYADNGGPLPRQKRVIYESGMITPLIIKFPDNRDAGTMSDRLVAFVDLPATILSLAGVPTPKTMHGVPFLGQYEGKPRQYVYGARDRIDIYYDKQGCVRDSKYRYVCNFKPEAPTYMHSDYQLDMPMMKELKELDAQGRLTQVQSAWLSSPREKEEFYDLANDPHEINNVIDEPKYAKDIARLREEYHRWNKEYNQVWFMSEPEYVESINPGGVQPQVAKPKVVMSDGMATITSRRKGVSFAYQINDSGAKASHWFLYDEPIKLAKGDRLTVVGVRIGYKDSETVKFNY